MTCIAAIVEDGKVWMGGDSAGSDGYTLSIRTAPKVFANGKFLIGYTTSFRMGQLLQWSFSPPSPKEGQDLLGYMVTDFVDAIRGCLKGAGWAERLNEKESGGNFLVGYRGRLFELASDYQVAEEPYGYLAVGCGHMAAKGSLYASTGKPPGERLKIALEAAERHSAGVRAPFTILSV